MNLHMYEHQVEGFLQADHPLSPRSAFQRLPALSKPLIAYSPQDIWQQDTNTLPRALRHWRQHCRNFAQQHITPYALAIDAAPHLAVGELHPAQRDLLITAGKQGFLTDLLPAPIGSAALLNFRFPLTLQVALKIEEFAAACPGQMLLLGAHNLGLGPLLMAADIKALFKFVRPAFKQTLRGDPHLFAFAITEPAAGSDVEESHGASVLKPGVVAKKVAGGYQLNGRKCFISGGDIAKSITVFAALEGEGMESWTCFLVHSDMPGFERVRSELKMGMRASAAAELNFNQVFVPASHLIGKERQGWALNRATLNYSRIPVAAMAVGIARAACELSMIFCSQHKLGGKRLIDFQHIQLQLADMLASTRAIRAFTWQAANQFVPRQGLSAASKFYCTDVAMQVCESAMDILGNQSLAQQQGAEKLFRDARLTQIFEGTNQINRLSLIEDMQEEFLALAHKE